MIRNQFDQTYTGSRIKSLREKRNLSMRELASRAGVAVSFISKLEMGKTSPTIMTLQKILEGLGITVVEFFSHDQKQLSSDSIVFRRKEMKILQSEDRRWFFAFPPHLDIKAVMTFEEYMPKTKVKEPEWHTNDICGFVMSGVLTLEIPDKGVFRVKKGDAFYVKAGIEHIAKNDDVTTLTIIVVQLKQ
jgi:transcriptional regulator with XRE-family HTH domain